MLRYVAFIVAACAATPSSAQPRSDTHAAASANATTWGVESGYLTYTVKHLLHTVSGVSHQLEGVAKVDGRGLKWTVEAAVSSFFTTNTRRDARVLEILDAAHFPAVIVRGFVPHFSLPAGQDTFDVPMKVAVELRGIGTEVPVVARVKRLDPNHLAVSFALNDSITGHNLARPTFLLWPVRDALAIEGEITLVAAAPK